MLRGSPRWKHCCGLSQPGLPGWSNENVRVRHWWYLAAVYSACAAFWSPWKLAGKAGSDSLHGQEPQKSNQIASSSPVCLSALLSGSWAQRPLLKGTYESVFYLTIRRSRTAPDLLFMILLHFLCSLGRLNLPLRCSGYLQAFSYMHTGQLVSFHLRPR